VNYLSVCSGIEAATCAWHDLGWNPVGFSEIEPFPSAVLKHHYPHVTNFGDMTKYKEWKIDSVGLLVGGTPCQSFSVAGLRKGLEDPRGNLAITYVGILDHFRPKWFIWENVPGVLSSNGGRDFGSFLGAVAELGYGFAYRVLDAQYVGGAGAVPQRRRRVFVVGYLGDWEPAAKVLFESKSLCRDIKKGRGKGKTVANCIAKSPATHSSYNPARGEGNAVLVKWPAEIASTLNASFGEKLGLENQHIDSGAPLFVHQPISFDERNIQYFSDENFKTSPTLTATDYKGAKSVIAPTLTTNDPSRSPQATEVTNQIAAVYEATAVGALCARDYKGVGNQYVAENKCVVESSMAVRRLTPRECERLQGFKDDYTVIPWKKGESPDGHRYKALGNSMAVPVMKWIGGRINEINKQI
jgi:DNA (cytosine-5)-methyltransferase 1